MGAKLGQPQGDDQRYLYHCPGCEELHFFATAGPVVWTWNGDKERPTVSPSIKVTGHEPFTGNPRTCHFFIVAGQLQFLSDCWHQFAGQTIDLILKNLR